MNPSTIDAHHHLWRLGKELRYDWLQNPGLEAIRHDYVLEDLQPLLRAEGIDRSIFVQTLADLDETRWALQLADQHSMLAGVVGWVDLASPECQLQVDEFRGNPKFVGVRHVVHDEPDSNWIVRPEILSGLKILEAASIPFDLLFRPEHLHHVPTLARACPNLLLVIDHLAKPPIWSGRVESWLEAIRVAARFPNVFCKLSGMVTEADLQSWQPNDLRPYVDEVVHLFGPNRLMFGSDWPVCELAASYSQVHQVTRDLLANLSRTELTAIFGGTAVHFYQISPKP